MLRSMYSGVSGMKGFQTKLDVIGNNIANVNTVGFKSSRVMFKDILSQSASSATAPVDQTSGGSNAKQIGLGVSIGSIDTMHLPGSAMTTNNPTDMRIDGDGFFAVGLTPDGTAVGDAFLTRAGDFHVDGQGSLVTSDGMYVLNTEGAAITIPTGSTFGIGSNGVVSIKSADGEVSTDNTLARVVVRNPEGLEKAGGNLYRVGLNAMPAGETIAFEAGDGNAGAGAIVTGQLEMSNVDLTSEFTEMITAQRGFQANSRIITTSDEMLQEVVNLKR
ncbi:flagellar hook-basal body complex protein [Saccharibacillus sp. CPCC 101409]|uniref:flagellar hook-basal body complex protein n=1 Tax=Saccharibacillus sp. CPCC 101409 TaxID=3058041 RepID=UPI0026716F7D|nr:flagellar hook-basal body complex protein [Saccharibacillus sp. CPCC 101409]MDO3410695.1 flagellar hook-basal body complex protein [Saccharibacillus sp. CPCC 101409]